MRKFLIYLGLLLAILFALSWILDVSYTYVYNNGTHRNKVMWVREMTNEKMDYIILGSSRANNHIDPNQIFDATGKKGYNLGVNAFSAFESHLMLKEFLNKNTSKQVYVQVDNRYIQDSPDPIGEKVWLPFIYEKYIFSEFEPYGSVYNTYKKLPFYRYEKFESRLGYRDIVTSALGKGFDYIPLKGYTPVYDELESDLPYHIDKPIVKENSQIKKIIERCIKENIEVYFFTAPMYKSEDDIAQLKKYLPNYHDFKDSISQRKLFGDQVHLNASGTEVFTEMFIETYFNK